MLARIDQVFFRVRAHRLLYRLTLFTRILLAAGFLPTGLVKLLGQRFTGIPADSPIGFLFEAFYQAGLYWRFIGASQILASLLLLWPRTGHLGALLFAPIIANIFVITVSMPFGGTPVVTGPMLLAVAYLCIWDYDRLRPLVRNEAFGPPLPLHCLDGWERIGFTVFAISTIGFFAVTRGLVPGQFASALVVTGLIAGVSTLIRFLWTSITMSRINSPTGAPW